MTKGLEDPRYSITEASTELVIVIHAKRLWSVILTLSPFLAFWTYFHVIDLISAIRGQVQYPSAMSFIGWISATVFLLYAIAWNIMGKEIILVNSSSLTHWLALNGMKPFRRREFSIHKITDVWILPIPPLAQWSRSMEACGIGGGNIALDWNAETYRFGIGLSEEEARDIVEILKAKIEMLPGRNDD